MAKSSSNPGLSTFHQFWTASAHVTSEKRHEISDVFPQQLWTNHPESRTRKMDIHYPIMSELEREYKK
jgi:hypothetical protein